MSAKVCKTCKWAKWKMSDGTKPRILNRHGACEWPIPTFPLLPISMIDAVNLDRTRSVIWPDSTTECPTWEGKK